jgi:uncharacterized protein (DUF697 family)
MALAFLSGVARFVPAKRRRQHEEQRAMSTYANPLTEYSPQMEAFEFSQSEHESYGESGTGVFSERDEMELAAELLEVTNEQELDRFLGDLIKKVGKGVGQFVQSPAGKAIGSVLKTVAKQALPVAGGALGAWVGGPIGARIGSGLASMAGQAMGLELEGLSQEDREFEATKQFVRFAGEATKNALTAPSEEFGNSARNAALRGAVTLENALAKAKAAAAEAARLHAPGLLRPFNFNMATDGQGLHGHSGRWIRKGNNIVLLGI